ncbi:hypothetical protein TBLA_0C05130 [Henningerozyma blattae CBS 6284]|uniref:Uncharacterized protein n=1 Tax=Henningerozyma blattae (strain ATCC 34711 / CBS 6284 / DSM 70876 / NBRC 10599 / NRRL Y-10934 / UCD 77-7) TaxID=1071380 RepID=I2H1Q7_HENB6|nr:hypothetical protein TBLA_0C05130 [Tetrapisispora blattae CBS 6284]CCH60309.1 hypothetical protein TBLA_0C05130 [Tetrapisispora blattae CBS 6284]
MIKALKIKPKYYDIAYNLTDMRFKGIYRGKKHHENDTKHVLYRAINSNVKRLLATGASIYESKEVIEYCKKFELPDYPLYYTIGVHPCCVNEFGRILDEKYSMSTLYTPSDDEPYNLKVYNDTIENPSFAQAKLLELYQLWELQLKNDPKNFRALGEFGLDYDKFNFSNKEMQKLFFQEQLKLVCLFYENHFEFLEKNPIGLFLHMRIASDDFVEIFKKFIDGFNTSNDIFKLKEIIPSTNPGYYKLPSFVKFVAHSFSDDSNALKKLLNVSPKMYIGLNGASLQNESNLLAIRDTLPIERIILETDAPWCEIKKKSDCFKYLVDAPSIPYKSVKYDKLDKITDDSIKNLTMIKDRNEPCNISQVAIIIAKLKNMELNDLIEIVWNSTCAVYGE